MKTLILRERGRLEIADIPRPQAPGPGEARVRVRRVGVCGTDFHAFRGRQPFFTYPRILGHELAVEVQEVGPGGEGRVRPGDLCAVEPYLHCGHCIACRRGRTNCCASLQVLGVHVDGGMREEMSVPVETLHPARGLDPDSVALVETLGIGAHAVARAAVEPGEWALVRGAGPIGLTVMQFCRLAGARVIALDIRPERLAFCRETLGVAETILGDGAALVRVREITDGDLPTAVFDATGSAASMREAFAFVAPGGRLVLVGLCRDDVCFHDPDFHRREISLLASRNSTAAEFTRILRLMQSGALDVRPWITHRASLTDIPVRFSDWLTPEAQVIKAVVDCDAPRG